MIEAMYDDARPQKHMQQDGSRIDAVFKFRHGAAVDGRLEVSEAALLLRVRAIDLVEQ